MNGQRRDKVIRSSSGWPVTPAMTADLYERFYDDLYQYALRLLRGSAQAEDVVQQAFAATIATVERGTVIRHPKRWLQRCVRNLCLNELRVETTVSLSEYEEPNVSETMAEIAGVKERCRAVYRALEDLPETQRSTFLLSEMRGLSYREIADMIGRTEDSVRKLLFRARKHVRDAVGYEDAVMLTPMMGLQKALLGGQPWYVRLRCAVQAKLTKIESSVAGAMQRSADAISQPALPMVAGAVAVAVLGVSTPGPARVMDRVGAGNPGSPPIAGTHGGLDGKPQPADLVPGEGAFPSSSGQVEADPVDDGSSRVDSGTSDTGLKRSPGGNGAPSTPTGDENSGNGPDSSGHQTPQVTGASGGSMDPGGMEEYDPPGSVNVEDPPDEGGDDRGDASSSNAGSNVGAGSGSGVDWGGIKGGGDQPPSGGSGDGSGAGGGDGTSGESDSGGVDGASNGGGANGVNGDGGEPESSEPSGSGSAGEVLSPKDVVAAETADQGMPSSASRA